MVQFNDAIMNVLVATNVGVLVWVAKSLFDLHMRVTKVETRIGIVKEPAE